MSVLGFETEWYDSVAGFSKVLFLKFFLDNNTIEILEDKGTFLKRIFYPSVTVNDLYVGNSITVYNRVLVIKKYANAATVRYMGSKEIHFVTTISSEEIRKLGLFIKLSQDYKLVMGKVRTTSSSYSNFGVELSPGDVIFETVGVNGADIESFTDAAQKMFTYGMTMALSPDKIADLMDSCTPASVPYDCTLCLIKPHIIKSGATGDIVASIAESGFGIVAAHSVHLTPQMAEDLMSVYMGLYPQYAAMIEQLCAGPALALMITGGPDVVNEFRDIVGPLKPEIAKTLRPNTLRARFGSNTTLNAIHCTDLPDDGVMECGFVFETIAGLDVKRSRK